MFLDEIKSVTAIRAAKLTGLNRNSIAHAMDLYAKTNGRLGLAFFVEDGKKNRKIRLCSIAKWLGNLEKTAAYAG